MKAVRTATLAVLCAASTACAPSMQVATPRPLPADLQLGRLSERTQFEQTDAKGEPIDGGADGLHKRDKAQRRRKAGFIAGVVGSALGGAMAIGFGAAGQVTENQLDDGYREGISRQDESDLQSRGEAFNSLAITGAALAVVGLGVTAIILGLDHRRCGDLIKRRRQECREPTSR